MKKINILVSWLMSALLLVACTKTEFTDTSFVDRGEAPSELSAMFEITQDNTGLVTITPNGVGAVTYDVYYGDGNNTPAKVVAGKNTTHVYPEGVYPVKIIGYSVSGKKTEVTKQLTVTFRAPENLEVSVTVDPANNYKVNVSATALYETNFKVYFGVSPTETPVTFLEGQTVSNVYAATGTYQVKVIAFSGGAATTQRIVPVTIVDPILLPLTFESPTINYNWFNFDGGNVTIVANSQSNGINTSAKVAKMVKNPGQPWGGSFLTLSSNIDFSANKIFRMKVYSPRVGAKVLFKVENSANPGQNFEKEVLTTRANAWEDLVIDYRAINVANSYNRIVLIFDNGTAGDGSANFTWLFDDIRLVNTLPLELPLDFEAGASTYPWFNFDGGTATVVANPVSGGINTSASVGKMVKNAGQVWGGSFLTLSSPMNFSTNKVFRMKVYSPRVGAKVLLKVENSANSGQNYEKEVTTSIANAWEDLVFDYSGINASNTYDRIVLIFELGSMGDGSSNYTFYFDDIRLTNTFPVQLPLNFEYPITYGWFDFDGGNVTVAANPSVAGINTSAKVAKMVKNAGQVWGGSFLTLDGPINFALSRALRMKVYSPRAGAKVLLKVENSANPGQNFEREVVIPNGNAWQELSFDFTGINTANPYDRVVIIFDLGVMGDGSPNFTYYFDDIRLN
jgi:hypothetical protein